MEPLFSTAGQARLDEIVRPGVLCVFDFDGTLAPITPRPEEAQLSQAMLTHLVALSSCSTVAIITGRAVDDIRSRLGFDPAYVVGNHGLEGVPGWQPFSRHEACCRAWHAELSAALVDDDRFAPGIWIENKRYTLSVHYRAAVDPEFMARRLVSLFETLVPKPRVVAGKSIFNLLPQDSADKGRAMEQLLRFSGAPAAIYVGDDVTDEYVFRLQRPDVLSVRVEYVEDSAAEFFIASHDEVISLLDELIRRLHPQEGQGRRMQGG